ncbi:hypothetical protein ACOMHN_045547 [Nucella lapillus]
MGRKFSLWEGGTQAVSFAHGAGLDKIKGTTFDGCQPDMDSQGPKCITEVAGFELVCLNPFVLETAYMQFRQEHDVNLDTTQAEKYRYTGYRQTVRWCYGFLGRSNRVPLPSCVVSRIRTEYPSDRQRYKGF